MFGYLSPSVRRDLFFTLFPRHASVLRSVCQSAPVSTNLIVPDSRSLHQKNSSCFSFIGDRFLSRHKERSPKPDGFGLLVEKFTLRRVIEISALGELGRATGCLETWFIFSPAPRMRLRLQRQHLRNPLRGTSGYRRCHRSC